MSSLSTILRAPELRRVRLRGALCKGERGRDRNPGSCLGRAGRTEAQAAVTSGTASARHGRPSRVGLNWSLAPVCGLSAEPRGIRCCVAVRSPLVTPVGPRPSAGCPHHLRHPRVGYSSSSWPPTPRSHQVLRCASLLALLPQLCPFTPRIRAHWRLSRTPPHGLRSQPRP